MTSRNMATKLISLFVILSIIYNASAGTLRKRKVFADAMETMERIKKEVQEIGHRLNEDVKDDDMPSPDNDEEKPEEPLSIPEINELAHTKELINGDHIHVIGDTLLTDEQVQIEKEDNALPPGVQLDAIRNPAQRWPKDPDGNVYIPYLIESSVRNNPTKRNGIRKAIEHYNAQSCIRWVSVTDRSKHHVRFINDAGCWSLIGKATYSQYKGYQPISIGENCGSVGVVEHEMLHCLGFFHEQARPDRDNYVKVMLYNLQNPSDKDQFEPQTAAKINSAGQPFDFESLMLYNSRNFARQGTWTMERRKPDRSGKKYIAGNTRHFSKIDLKQLNAVYECKGYPKPPPAPRPVKRCNGKNSGCCTPYNKCINGDGDCDDNADCKSGRCGENNCEWDSYKWWHFGNRDDCCY